MEIGTPSYRAFVMVMHNQFLDMATFGDGRVWCSPLCFAWDGAGNFVFQSRRSTLHSYNIRKNPEVAISIYSSGERVEVADGIQARAQAEELVREEDILGAYRFYQRRLFPDPEIRRLRDRPADHYMAEGGGTRSFYRLTLTEAYVLGQEKYDDMREPVDLDDLRAALMRVHGGSVSD